jgi:hypothetical protein
MRLLPLFFSSGTAKRNKKRLAFQNMAWIRGGGTNADGTKSENCCSYGYQNGEFVGGNITVEDLL